MGWFSKKGSYKELQTMLDSMGIFNGTESSPDNQRVLYDLDGIATASNLGILIALKDNGFTFCMRIDGADFVVHSPQFGLRPVTFPWKAVNKTSLGCLLNNMKKLSATQLAANRDWSDLLTESFDAR